MSLDIDVVEITLPLLIELDVLYKHKLYINNVENILVCVSPK